MHNHTVAVDGSYLAATQQPDINEKMKAIEDLTSKYLKFKFEFPEIEDCIKWAEDRLQKNEENHDQDIILLAGSIDKKEAEEYVEAILKTYIGTDITKDEYLCGQYVVDMYDRYKNNQISIIDLDTILSKLYRNLNYPDWLVMLSRNCEYATDVDNFIEPFEQEFYYIAKLWLTSESLNEFMSKYSRDISNTHDITY